MILDELVYNMMMAIKNSKSGIMANIPCYKTHVYLRNDIYQCVFVLVRRDYKFVVTTILPDRMFIPDHVDDVLEDFADPAFAEELYKLREDLYYSPLAVSLRAKNSFKQHKKNVKATKKRIKQIIRGNRKIRSNPPKRGVRDE